MFTENPLKLGNHQMKRVIMSTCPHCKKTASGDWLVKAYEDYIVKCNRCGKDFVLIMINNSGIVIQRNPMGERNDV